jgi:hypothetical protein
MKRIALLVAIVISVIYANAQTAAKQGKTVIRSGNGKNSGDYELPRGSFGGDFFYTVSTLKHNADPKNILFQGDGMGAGFFYRYRFGRDNRFALVTSPQYVFGKTATADLESYAQTLVKEPFTYKITELQLESGTGIDRASNFFWQRSQGSVH